MGENTSSWVKAYNEVVKDHKSGSNTVSIAELRGKPGVNGLFSERSERHSDFSFPETLKDRSIFCNGYNILTLTRDEVMAMTISQARETLYQLRVEGNLVKKGFRRLKLWRLRYFVLSGKMLNYYEVLDSILFNYRPEITTSSVIMPKLRLTAV